MSARLRRAPTEEDLRQVAEIWAESDIPGGAPTATVADEFGVSISTAYRWITAARRAGLLDTPARRGGR